MKLPSRVKRRMYVVHTSALPEDCELRVAPTGTAGTIRLDQLQKSRGRMVDRGMSHRNWGNNTESTMVSMEEDTDTPSAWAGANSEYDSSSVNSFEETNALPHSSDFSTSFANLSGSSTTSISSNKKSRANSMFSYRFREMFGRFLGSPIQVNHQNRHEQIGYNHQAKSKRKIFNRPRDPIGINRQSTKQKQ